MIPNTQNKKDLEVLGFTYSVEPSQNPNPYTKKLRIQKGDVWAGFSGIYYQDGLTAFLLGWKSALDITT